MKKCLLIVVGIVSCLATNASDVKPRNYYGSIGRQLGDMLTYCHILQHPLDDSISMQAWTNLVSIYDFDHSVFLKSDLEEFSAHKLTIDDEIKDGDVNFGYDVYNRYVERLRERVDFATNLLVSANWDFTSNETYQVKRKDAPWPETKAEAEELWRKRIKNELLVMKIAHELDKSTNRLDAVENIVKKYRQYLIVLTEPDEEMVLQHYMSAICRAYDPHTDYMTPTTKEDFDMEMNLSLCGVGAVLSTEDGALKIEDIMPGGPIDVDGRIKEGDKIVGVKQGDGEMEDIMWQPSKKSIKKIRGPKGTKVTLEIIPRSDPSGATRKLIELVRDKIKLEDQAATGHVERVTLDGVEHKLGYVYLPEFYGTMDKQLGEEGFRSSAMDVAKYIADFNAQGVDGLVLDLRGDGGGSLREAVNLSALFVQSGPVVQIRDVRTVGSLSIPPGNPVAFKKPMVVLTDRASASASEIVAGHLQDTGRAIVIGDSRTHGKGTVQTVLGVGSELGVGSDKFGSIKVTTARFYRITGRSTQMEGVVADIYMPSLLDSLDIGEDKLDGALPFSKIRPANYRLSWDMHKYVKELNKLSNARTSKNDEYLKHINNVKGMKELSERQVVSLEYEARKAQMKNDRELSELDDENDDDEANDKKRRRKRMHPKEDDVVLDEAYRVLMDIIRLKDGESLPEVKGWWY